MGGGRETDWQEIACLEILPVGLVCNICVLCIGVQAGGEGGSYPHLNFSLLNLLLV